MSIFKKQSGVWKESNNIGIKQTGVWKDVTQMFVKNGGVWKSLLSNSKYICWLQETDTNKTLKPMAITKDNSGNTYILYERNYTATIIKFSKTYDILVAKNIPVSPISINSATYMPAIDAVAFTADKYVIFVHASNLLAYNSSDTVIQFPDRVSGICDDPRYNNRVFVANYYIQGSYYDGNATANIYSIDLVNFSNGYYGAYYFNVGTTYSVYPATTVFSNLVFDSSASKLYLGGSAVKNDYVGSTGSYHSVYNVSGYNITAVSSIHTFFYYQSFYPLTHWISQDSFSGTTNRLVSGNYTYNNSGNIYRYGLTKIDSAGTPIISKYVSNFTTSAYKTYCGIDSKNNAILIIYGTGGVYFVKFDSNLNYLGCVRMIITNNTGASSYPFTFYACIFKNDIITLSGYRASSSLYYRSMAVEIPTDLDVPLNTVMNINGTYYLKFTTSSVSIADLGLSNQWNKGGNSGAFTGATNTLKTFTNFSSYGKIVHTYE